MALTIKLASGEEFWLNGTHCVNRDKRATLLIQTPAIIVTSRHVVTEEEASRSPVFALARTLFLHLSGQVRLNETALALTRLDCVKHFPELVPIAHKQDTFALLNALVKKIR